MKKNYILVLFAIVSLSSMQAQKVINRNETFKRPTISKKNYLESANQVSLYSEGNDPFFSKAAKTKTTKSFPDFEFVNGINIAWINFSADVGLNRYAGGDTWEAGQEPVKVQFDKFREIFKQVADAGGDVLRWWLHTDGMCSPIYGKDEKTKLTPDYIHEDIVKILDIAKEEGVKIQICLWSFDMAIRKDYGERLVGNDNTKLVNVEANKRLLLEPEYMKAYFDNALIPMVKAVGNHDGLYAWEIFNEPEGMSDITNWAGVNYAFKLTMTQVQTFVNKAAAAIRATNRDVKITNGAWGFKTSVNDSSNGFENQYTNEKLINAGGEALGYLDFYNIHYYDWAGTTGSPFVNDFDKYGLDKPTVIAEYYPNNNNNSIERTKLATTLHDRGWHGSLSWSHSDAYATSKQDGLKEKARKNGKKESDLTYTFEDMLQIIRSSKTVLSNEILNQPKRNTDTKIRRVVDLVIVENIPSEVKNIVVYNMSGSIVTNQKTEKNTSSVDFSGFASGIYLISFEHNNKLFVEKIIK